MPPEEARSTLAAIALGSNLPSVFGGPEENLREALRRLETLGVVTAVSSFHSTAPVGYLDQPRFLNAAALLSTRLPPLELLRGFLEIEKQMGRDRISAPPKGPRIIDLDLLLYGNQVLQTPDLVVPHPAMHQRTFVLSPLVEIAADWLHPVLRRSVKDLLDRAATVSADDE